MATSYLVYESIQVAIKYHSLDGVHNRNVFSQLFRMEVQDEGTSKDFLKITINFLVLRKQHVT